MNQVQIIIERLRSTNPKFFRGIIWMGILIYLVAQLLLWVDARIDLAFIDEGVRGLLDDICGSSLTAVIVSQLTTTNKSLSEK